MEPQGLRTQELQAGRQCRGAWQEVLWGGLEAWPPPVVGWQEGSCAREGPSHL